MHLQGIDSWKSAIELRKEFWTKILLLFTQNHQDDVIRCLTSKIHAKRSVSRTSLTVQGVWKQFPIADLETDRNPDEPN